MEDMLRCFFLGVGPLKLIWLNNILGQLEDAEDMFTCVLDMKEFHQFFFIHPIIDHKSEPNAERARTEGNILYKDGHLRASLHCYDTCITLAPHPELQVSDQSEEKDDVDAKNFIHGARCEPLCCKMDLEKYKALGFGYANRSAVFMGLKEYDHCLADIDMAVNYGYPTQLRSKLEERKERCLTAKKRSGNVRSDPVIVSNNGKTPPQLPTPNPCVPSFSSALKVAFSTDEGRHVVASRDILPGEVIAVENSYCSQVFSSPDKEHYCPVCLMQCQKKIPCPNCCLIVFCSDSCRAKGLKEHMKECKSNVFLYSLDLEEDPIAGLAMKLVIHTTYLELKDKVPLLKRESKEFPQEKLGFDMNGKFSSADYRSVYHMVTSHSKKRSSNILQSCIKAFLITKALEHSQDFFVTREGVPFEPTREDLILTGTALLRRIIFSTPIFTISDIQVGPRCVDTTKNAVGTGIYPALCLMRHSCNPPTIYYNFGHVKIARTVSHITAGQEVTMAFADRYQITPLPFRVIQMEMNGITCSCEACVGLWPVLSGISNEMYIKCIKCSNPVTNMRVNAICASCGINYSKPDSKEKKKNPLVKKWWSVVDQIDQGKKKFQRIYRKFEMGQRVTNNDYEIVCNFAGLIGKHVQQPSMIFCFLRDALVMFFYMEM